MSNFNEQFLTFFKEPITQQEIRANRTNSTITEILSILGNHSQNDSTENLVGAPRRSTTDPEFLIKALSTSLNEFSYDPENDCIFENWYRRFQDFFDRDAANLDDAAETRLLLRKLDTAAHNRYLILYSRNYHQTSTLLKLLKN